MVSLNTSELFGVMSSIVFLAIVAVAIINGDKTAKIIGESGKAFSSAITAATHPGKA